VAGGDDLRTLLATKAEFRGLIAQVVDRNARYNIGVTRNFNEPTLPLLLLESKRVADVKFSRGSVVKDGDSTLVTLQFAERGRPTLVRGPDGSMPATGEMVIEADTGTIRRTRFDRSRRREGSVVHDLRPRSPPESWLPDTFTERYDTSAAQEIVLCEALYSNYRRFEVNTRIK
jgi:hypothetical protein